MPVSKDLRILIVDDNATMRRVLRTLLRQLGFDAVDEAGDGGAALDGLGKTDYGLIISDWNMEPMSGIELVRAVRADATLKHVPFLMVTSESDPEHRKEAMDAGVSGYLLKPVTAESLKAKMAGVLGPF